MSFPAVAVPAGISIESERGELGIVSTTDVNRALRAVELRSGHSMA